MDKNPSRPNRIRIRLENIRTIYIPIYEWSPPLSPLIRQRLLYSFPFTVPTEYWLLVTRGAFPVGAFLHFFFRVFLFERYTRTSNGSAPTPQPQQQRDSEPAGHFAAGRRWGGRPTAGTSRGRQVLLGPGPGGGGRAKAGSGRAVLEQAWRLAHVEELSSARALASRSLHK